jgi:enoyl-CoA hydratase/carnithine racemase
MDYEHLLVKVDGAAGRITLNRPERRNALSQALMEELLAALDELTATPGVRVVVIGAAGRVFSAGHDLAEMVGRDQAYYQRLFDTCTVMMQRIAGIPQPVIAKVHGVATAAGCQLVASCDLVVAEEGARFATPGVRIGLFCSTPMVPLTRAIGRKRALEMLLTGEMVPAQRAADWGLVNRVVPADALDETVDALVDVIAAASPLTVGLGKQAFYAQVELDEHRAYDHTKVVMTANAQAGDAQEGMTAFLAKRDPVWTGS